MELEPLKIKVVKGVVAGTMYNLTSYDEYASKKEFADSNTGILEEYNGTNIVIPYRGDYNGPTGVPGVYNAGSIDFVILPSEDNISKFVPSNIIEMDNTNSIKEILEKKEAITHLDEHWITSPDNITHFNISQSDKPEMVCLKTALNKKEIDIDKYASRFGDNFPNDKRQLKNNSVTLNILKRFCDNMDMECMIILKDKNENVPNPIGEEVIVSLTEDCFDEEEDE